MILYFKRICCSHTIITLSKLYTFRNNHKNFTASRSINSRLNFQLFEDFLSYIPTVAYYLFNDSVTRQIFRKFKGKLYTYLQIQNNKDRINALSKGFFKYTNIKHTSLTSIKLIIYRLVHFLSSTGAKI